MVERGCPHCHGSVHYESYLAQGETIREFTCINCSRVMTPRDFYDLGALHENCTECAPVELTKKARMMMFRIGFRSRLT